MRLKITTHKHVMVALFWEDHEGNVSTRAFLCVRSDRDGVIDLLCGDFENGDSKIVARARKAGLLPYEMKISKEDFNITNELSLHIPMINDPVYDADLDDIDKVTEKITTTVEIHDNFLKELEQL